jgi:hypothetical protein
MFSLCKHDLCQYTPYSNATVVLITTAYTAFCTFLSFELCVPLLLLFVTAICVL